MYYSKGDAIGTKVYRRSGRLSEVVVKRGSTVYMQLSFPSSLFAITVDTYFFSRYAARGDRTRTAPLRRYATNLNAMLHSLVINQNGVVHC